MSFKINAANAKLKIAPKIVQKSRNNNKEKNFSNLSNPEKEDELKESYSPILENAGQWANIVSYVATYLSAAFSNKDLFSFSRPINVIPKGDGKNVNGPFIEQWTALYETINEKSLQNNITITGNTVSFSFPRLQVPVSFDWLATAGEDRNQSVAQTFKVIFKDWKMPTIAQILNEKTGMATLISDKYTTDFEPAKEVMDLRFSHVNPAYNGYIPDDTDYDEDIERGIANSLLIRLSLEPMQIPANSLAEKRQSLASIGSVTVSTTLNVDAKIVLPLEMAYWMTFSKEHNDFIPSFALNHISKIVKQGGVEYPKQRAMTLNGIHQNNAKIQKMFNYEPKVRTNADGFAFTNAGSIIFIPNINKAEEYTDILKKAYDPSTGLTTPESEIKQLSNMPIGADWMNDVFCYTSNEGALLTNNISGCIPLDDVTIGKYMHHTLGEPFGTTADTTKDNFLASAAINYRAFLNLGDTAYDQFNLAKKYGANSDRSFTTFSTLFSTILLDHKDDSILHTFGSANNQKTDGKDTKYIRAFIDACRNISDNIMNINGYSISTLMHEKFGFHLFGYYASKGAFYANSLQNAVKTNNAIDYNNAIPPSSRKLPSLPGLKALMWHQAQIAEMTAKLPSSITLDIDPGGGKTGITLVAIVQALEKSPSERVGIIVPDILLKEWYNAISNFSQNQINCICLSTKIIENMIKNLKMDRSKFLQYIQKAPPNTIVVIGMNFLNLKRDLFDVGAIIPEVKYGNNVIECYPNTLLVRQMGLTRLYVDEVHRAKNNDAIITRNIKNIRSDTSSGGILSGTLISNVGTDLISQFSINNPAILINGTNFEKRFGVVDPNGNFLGYKKNANSLLVKDSQPYTLWVQKGVKDWSYVLPKIYSQYYEVYMTPKQQDWNNTLINESVKALLEDPKIKKLLAAETDNEAALHRLEQAVKSQLAKVEIFINAPDSRPEPDKDGQKPLYFADISGIKPKDLISAKVPYIERIVYHHFNGGEFKDPNGKTVLQDGMPIVFKKQKSKVIVFCHHKKVVDHIFANLKVPGINIVKYQAGDDEVITRFKEDPNVHVLVAAETSLREGVNLQCASRVIKVETSWSEGAETQIISRVMRPDVYDRFSRTEINVDIILTMDSMEIPKRARLISKLISNSRIRNFDSNYHKYLDAKNIDELPLVKMNFDTLRELTNPKSMQLAPYYKAQSVIEDWKDMQFAVKRDELKKLTAARLNIPVDEVTPAQIKAFAMLPVEYSGRLPDSRQIWTPIPDGAMPYDPRNLDLKPLVLIPEIDEDDEVDEDSEDIITAEPGSTVWTEYGFGKLEQVAKNYVKVAVPNMGSIRLGKGGVFLPTNTTATKNLEKQIQANNGISFLRGGDPLTNPASQKISKKVAVVDFIKPPNPPSKPVIEPENVSIDTNKIDRFVGKNISLEVGAGVLNGYPSVYLFDEGNGSELEAVQKAMPSHVWRLMPAYSYWHIKSYRAIDPILEMLKTNFAVPSSVLAQFKNMASQLYRKGFKSLEQTAPLEWGTKNGEALNYNFSNFFRLNHTPPTNPNGLRIYPVVEDGELYLCAVIGTQKRQIQKLNRLMTQLRSFGVAQPGTVENMCVHLSHSIPECISVIDNLKSKFKVVGTNDAIKALKSSTRLLRK